jgi:CheY-like chemotaxis protein
MKMTNHIKHTIIWADDDPDDIYLIRQVMDEADLNFNIVELQNGKEVLEHLSTVAPEDYPCLIVLDINMPVMDGKQTLSHIKRHPQLSTIPVAMFTTSNSSTDKLFCSHFGAELVTKPATYTAFKGSVEKLLKQCAERA